MSQHRQEVEVGVHPDLLHRSVGSADDDGRFLPGFTRLELDHQLPTGFFRRKAQGRRARGAGREHVHQQRELRGLAAQVVEVGEEHQRLLLPLPQVGDHGAHFQMDVVLVRDLQPTSRRTPLHGIDVRPQLHHAWTLEAHPGLAFIGQI